jgi:hypothetical protein
MNYASNLIWKGSQSKLFLIQLNLNVLLESYKWEAEQFHFKIGIKVAIYSIGKKSFRREVINKSSFRNIFSQKY